MFVFSSEPELSGFGKIVKKNAMIFAMDFAAKDAAEVKSSADKNSVVKDLLRWPLGLLILAWQNVF